MYNKDYQRAYYLEHHEEKIAASKAWRENNRERDRERARSWASRNPQKRAEITSRFYEKHDHVALVNAWRKANPEKFRRLARRSLVHRRARLANASGSWTNEQWFQRCAFYGWRCFYCKVQLSELTITVDHRIPLSRGGSNWPSNLVPACKSCNCKKGARLSHAK